MPIFEFICGKCGHKFEALVYGTQSPACPKCGSPELERVLSTFATAGGSKRESAPAGCGPAGGG